MNTENSNLTVKEAQKILAKFITDTKLESQSVAAIREALLLITSLSDSENLGVCADTAHQGLIALKSYLKAMGYQPNFDTTNIPDSGSVYIKFNTQKMSYYIDSYTGEYRGVLVSCQSAEHESINSTYGHLPLDLFM